MSRQFKKAGRSAKPVDVRAQTATVPAPVPARLKCRVCGKDGADGKIGLAGFEAPICADCMNAGLGVMRVLEAIFK